MTELPKEFADSEEGQRRPASGAAETGSGPPPPCADHPFVSILVPTVGNRPTLERCLDSLAAQDCARCEILLILNGPWSDTFAQRVAHHPVQLFHEPRPGVCKARNSVIPQAKGEILVFVDDDIVAHPQWLHEVLKGFENHSVACVVGRVIPEGVHYLRGPGGKDSFLNERALRAWTFGPDEGWFQKFLRGNVVGFGCNMAFRRRFLEKSSRFPEELGAGALIGAADENYMFLQVLKHGFHIHHTPSAVVTHFHGEEKAQQMARLRELRAATVAFHLKLLWEEKGYRWATVKCMFAGWNRFLQASFEQNTGLEVSELLTPTERLSAYWQGFRNFWKSRQRNSSPSS